MGLTKNLLPALKITSALIVIFMISSLFGISIFTSSILSIHSFSIIFLFSFLALTIISLE